MHEFLSRRMLLIAGAAVVLDGCSRRGHRPEAAEPSVAPTVRRPRSDIPAHGHYHTVAPGETLASIARDHGIPLDHVIDANGLTRADVRAGERLWLPGAKLARSPAPREREVEEAEAPDDEVVRGGYVLVPRSAWTKQPVKGNNRPMGKVTRLTVHHTDEHGGMVGLPDIEVIRRIENYHRGPEKRWAAIGYHYLIGKDGRVYEGRPTKYQGAHVSGANENNVGISVIGDFQRKLPSARQLAALQSFLNDTRDRFKVGRSRVYGHRDLNRSICPGAALHGWLQRYKAA
ncbi:MAG: N-acetylmuramoyl-L-alanine amidase [Planctomycetes bacterium]|nr:N-acetylmuramoyl-L-alanine amidase [Planctomycetota bacterium]